MEFKGCYTALVTPFNDDGSIDYDAYAQLINWQIAEGITGLVPCGCTGEAATLSHQEQKDLISFAIRTVQKRVPVIAGTGSNNTAEALDLTAFAEKAGADGALLITPYYNKPTPAGLYAHYKTIAEAVTFPVMLYNVPGRTGTNIPPATVVALSKLPNIPVIKEASGSMDQASTILNSCDITVLSGDDALTLPMVAVGGSGVVSVVANIIPGAFTALTNAALDGDMVTAQKAHQQYFNLFKAMFIETNPLPIKTALAMMGRIKENLRLPLVGMREENRAALAEVLRTYKLIK